MINGAAFNGRATDDRNETPPSRPSPNGWSSGASSAVSYRYVIG
jgi:hypothetical protein